MSKDDTIVLLDGAAGARDGIEESCAPLLGNIVSIKSDCEKEELSERPAKLHSGVAVIKVCIFQLFPGEVSAVSRTSSVLPEDKETYTYIRACWVERTVLFFPCRPPRKGGVFRSLAPRSRDTSG